MFYTCFSTIKQNDEKETPLAVLRHHRVQIYVFFMIFEPNLTLKVTIIRFEPSKEAVSGKRL